MSNFYSNKNSYAIAAGAIISIFLMQDPGAFFYTGILGAASLVLMALISPWMGLLALFPLAFALRPAPPSIGPQELAFAVLLTVIFIASLVKILRSFGINAALKLFAAPLLIGLGILSINLTVAMTNHVPLSDWLRGTVPFLFIYALLPVSALIGDDESKIRWVGGSFATLIFLTAGYIVFYYFYQGIWRPYWIVPTDGEAIKLTKEAAMNNLNAIGPMRDRITMVLAQATDSLLPVGIVAGFVTSVLTRNKYITYTGAIMSLLCMTAVLITFTRSMLLSALLVVILFSSFIFFFRKNLRKKLSISVVALGVYGLAFIFATGMQQIWLGRMSLLVESGIETIVNWAPTPEAKIENSTALLEPPLTPKESADFNVSSRVEEYRIAWGLFTAHPVLGNGLGIKHEMRWETANGTSFTQFVAYVHNWPLYILMVGGALGVLTYSLVLLGPILFRITSLRSESEHWTIIRAVVLTLAIYGLFFAVFRLITFNLLLAAAWGVIFAQDLSRKYNSQRIPGKDARLGALSGKPDGASDELKSADEKNMELPV
jgi:hypothetical protein